MISKHHNWDYSGGIPEAVGDRYVGQDLFRDRQYMIDRLGLVFSDLSLDIPFLLSGGVVTQGTGDTLNITAGIGFAKYSVTVPNSYASDPPTTTSEDIESIRVAWIAQTNMAISSAVLDGVTTNYVKVRYSESNGSSRSRTNKAGSYTFEKSPSFTIVVDDSAPTDYDILLDTFTGSGGGSFTFTGLTSQHSERKLEVDDDDYTVLDTDGYKHVTFDNLTADRDFNLPTLSANEGREFFVTNLDGGYDVNIHPEGSEDINDWNVDFPITEKYGTLYIRGLSDRWLVVPLNNACIYEVSSETADTGLALDGSWDDVSGMTLLNGIYGYGYLDAHVIHEIQDTSVPEYYDSSFGIGKTSGDNAPDIIDDGLIRMQLQTDDFRLARFSRNIYNFPYESDGSTIYMKVLGESDEMNITGHAAYGATKVPMFIRWIRRY